MKALDQKDEKINHSVIMNIQKHLCVLSILKVMTVCITTYGSSCFFFSSSVTDLSQEDFVKSTAYLIHYWH